MNYQQLKETFSIDSLSLSDKLQVLYLTFMQAHGISIDDLFMLLPRSVANQLLYNNSSLIEEFMHNLSTLKQQPINDCLVDNTTQRTIYLQQKAYLYIQAMKGNGQSMDSSHSIIVQEKSKKQPNSNVDNRMQLFSVKHILIHLNEGLKIYLFTYTQDQEEAIKLVKQSNYYKISQEFMDRQNGDFNQLLSQRLQELVDSLKSHNSEVYQLQRLLITTKCMYLLNQQRITDHTKYIIQSFSKAVIDHFLFCYTKHHQLMIYFIEQTYNEIISSGYMAEVSKQINTLLQAYSVYYNVKLNIPIEQSNKSKQSIQDYYYIPELLYITLTKSTEIPLENAALIVEYYRQSVYGEYANVIIKEIIKLVSTKLQSNPKSVAIDIFKTIDYSTDPKQLYNELSRYISSRYLQIKGYQWMLFLFQIFQTVRPAQHLLNDNTFVMSTVQYIANNQTQLEIRNMTHLQLLEAKIFELLLHQDTDMVLCNHLMFVLAIFDKQVYTKLLAILLYQHYKRSNDPKLFQDIQSLIADNLITNAIILGAIQLLDQWCNKLKGQTNNPFIINYPKLKKKYTRIGYALLSQAQYTECIYNLEYYICQKQLMHKFENHELAKQDKLITILKYINMAQDNLNKGIDLESALIKLGFDELLIKSIVNTPKQEYQLVTLKLAKKQIPLQCQIFNLLELDSQQQYLNINTIESVLNIFIQLTADISQYFMGQITNEQIQQSIDYIKMTISLSIKTTSSINSDNINVILAAHYISKLQILFDMLKQHQWNNAFQFTNHIPTSRHSQIFNQLLLYILRLVKKHKCPIIKLKQQQYKHDYAVHLYKTRQYDETLHLIRKDKFFSAKIYARLGKYFLALDCVKLERYDILSNKTFTLTDIKECRPYMKLLKYSILGDYHREKILMEYNQVYLNRESAPLSHYFKQKRRLENFLFHYATQLEDDYKYVCDCTSKRVYCIRIFDIFLQVVHLGDRYIHESFPKIFRIWFNHTKKDQFSRKVDQFLQLIPPSKLIHALDLLITGVEIFKNDVAAFKSTCQALSQLAYQYPDQMIWWLGPLKHFNENSQHKVKAYQDTLSLIPNPQIVKKLENLEKQFVILVKLSNQKSKCMQSQGWAVEAINQAILSEYLKNEEKLIYPGIEYTSPPFKEPVKIEQIQPQFRVAPSKDKPKRLFVLCSDKQIRSILLKREIPDSHSHGDTRREQRIIGLLRFLNTLLEPLGLQYPLFASLCLSQMNQVIEWLDCTLTLKSVISHPITCRANGLYSNADWDKLKLLNPKIQSHFFQTYENAHDWYQAQQQFIETMALWSAFSYMIGFGDRHCDNILINECGQIIHIDYDCVFHKNRYLPIPEIVDFRLTKNLRYGMGYALEQGLFKKHLSDILQQFVYNQDKIIAFLDPYIYDPLLCRTASSVVDLLKKKLQLRNTDIDNLIDRNQHISVLKQMFHGWAAYL